MKLHFRAPSGTRIEETERLVAQAEERIRKIIPADELQTINSMIGVPSSYNLAFVPTDNVGGMDAEILIDLKAKHHPTEATCAHPRATWRSVSRARPSTSSPPTSSARCSISA